MAEAHGLETPPERRTKFNLTSVKAGVRKLKRKLKIRIINNISLGTSRGAATRLKRRRLRQARGH